MNGAQGDVGPNTSYSKDEYENCQILAEKLAEEVVFVAKNISLSDQCALSWHHSPYAFDVKPTSQGLLLPLFLQL